MIGQSPRHEKPRMGQVWIGPNSMVGPPWWRTEPAQRRAVVVEVDDLIDRGMVTPEQIEAAGLRIVNESGFHPPEDETP